VTALFEWIFQIGCLALIAGLVEMVLPGDGTKGAVRLVAGLVLILSVVEPAARWIGDPGAALRIAGIAAVEDGAPYVDAGVRLAEATAKEVRGEWERTLERQLAALVGLLPGVRGAEVDVRLGQGGAVEAVEIAIAPEEGGGDVDVQNVRRLVAGFAPGVDPGAVLISIGR